MTLKTKIRFLKNQILLLHKKHSGPIYPLSFRQKMASLKNDLNQLGIGVVEINGKIKFIDPRVKPKPFCYVQSELDRLTHSEYAKQVILLDGTGTTTKTLNINTTSIPILIRFLKNELKRAKVLRSEGR